MTVRISVVDPLPMFQRGVAAELIEAGYPVELPDDVLAWLRQSGEAVVVLTLASEQDWRVLSRLRAEPSSPRVIVLLDEDSATTGARAVRAGARSVLSRRVSGAALRRTVEATLGGQAVMPADVALVLAGPTMGSAPGPALIVGARPELPDRELAWLRQLADGLTVAQVADRAGYSERAMFRILRVAYERLGVRTRLEAIMRAKEAGWL